VIKGLKPRARESCNTTRSLQSLKKSLRRTGRSFKMEPLERF